MSKNINNKGGSYNSNFTPKQNVNSSQKDNEEKEQNQSEQDMVQSTKKTTQTENENNMGNNEHIDDHNVEDIKDNLSGKRLKVFVADFDEDLVQTLTQLQERKPSLSIVGAANDGQLAKDLISNVNPDVIYLSKDLDLLDGIELTEQIKNELGDIPVVISTFDETLDIREAGKVADEVLTRPFSEEEFMDALVQAYVNVKRRKKRMKEESQSNEAPKHTKKLGGKKKKSINKTINKIQINGLEDIEKLNKLVEKGKLSEEAKNDILKFHNAEVVRAKQNLIAVYSPKGGVGTTTLATNLALTIAKEVKELNVLLVDFDFKYNDVDIMLDVANTSNIIEVFDNYDEKKQKFLDEKILQKTIIKHDSGLDLLLAPEKIEQSEHFTAEFIEKTIELIQTKTDYDIIIADTTTSISDETTFTTLEKAKNVLLVGTQEVTVVKDIKRVLKILRQLKIDMSKFHLILNKHGYDGVFDVSEVNEFLNMPVVGMVTNDYNRVLKSINIGQPIVLDKEPSEVMKNIMNIARLSSVCPEMKKVDIPEMKKGFFSSLFGGGSSKKKSKKVKKKKKKKTKKKSSKSTDNSKKKIKKRK
jgi:pilus assembly protein CpaE